MMASPVTYGVLSWASLFPLVLAGLVSCVPIFDLPRIQTYLAIRPTNSSGAYIHGVDTMVVEINVDRDDSDVATYTDEVMVFYATRVGQSGWDLFKSSDFKPFTVDVSTCPASCDPSELACCASVTRTGTTNSYTIYLYAKAYDQQSGALFKAGWPALQELGSADAVSGIITLPWVCRTASNYVTHQISGAAEVTTILNENEKTISVDNFASSSSLTFTFTVTNLEGTNEVEIQWGNSIAKSSQGNVSITLSNEDIGASLKMNLSYTEEGVSPGCGRSGTYHVTLNLASSDSSSDDYDTTRVAIACICVGIALIITVIL